MPNLPIIVLASSSWTGRRVNSQHLISRLAQRGWPVVYSSGAMYSWERSRPEWRSARWYGTSEALEGVLVDDPGRLAPRWRRFPAWDRLAIHVHLNRLLKYLCNPSRDELICYVFDPIFLPYARQLHARYLVFHIYDAFELTPEFTDELWDWEIALAEEADLLVVTSRGMIGSFSHDLRAKALELPNGVEAERFMAEPQECPSDLALIPRPRIGYAGAINAKVDLALMIAIAKQRPDWHWVLIGTSILDDQWQILRNLPNVHWLGDKSYSEMPSYLHNMDVNTMCYVTDGVGWWIHGYPLKMHELLAVGKPIVSTALATILPFSHVVEIARTPEQWIEALERALNSGGRGTTAERRAVALKNTWDQRVDLLESRLRKMIYSDTSV